MSQLLNHKNSCQSNVLNNKKYLHITSSEACAGALKVTLNKGVQVATPGLNLSTCCLPKELSKDEYLRCKQHEYINLGDGTSFEIFGANLSKYDGIVVWHSVDVESMLLFAMIAYCYDGTIFHIDVSKTYHNRHCGELIPDELLSCISSYKVLSLKQRMTLKEMYGALPYEIPCIKKYIGKHFEVVEKEILKNKLLRYVKPKPLSWLVPSGYAMAKSRLGEFYSAVFWDCLTLELICEGRAIISDMTFKRDERYQFPLGCCLTKPYLYNGFDLRKLYFFRYFKVK